jgi:hypothetical protein
MPAADGFVMPVPPEEAAKGSAARTRESTVKTPVPELNVNVESSERRLPVPTNGTRVAVRPVTTRLVLVALPEMVRPPVAVPSPIVEVAYAVSPWLNWVKVEVELPVPWNGYGSPLPEPHADAFAETVPSAPTSRQRVPEPPAEETMRFVDEAVVAEIIVVLAYGMVWSAVKVLAV